MRTSLLAWPELLLAIYKCTSVVHTTSSFLTPPGCQKRDTFSNVPPCDKTEGQMVQDFALGDRKHEV